MIRSDAAVSGVAVAEPDTRWLPPVPAAFADTIGYHLRIAQEASFAAIHQAAGGLDIRPGWYTILTLLAETPGGTPSELSLRCGRDRSTLTGTLKELARRGLISRRRKTHDQRSYAVRLTAEGDALLERMREFSMRHDARLDDIAGAEKPALIAALRRIAFELGAAARKDDAVSDGGGERESPPRKRRSDPLARP